MKQTLEYQILNGPRHDKTNKMTVHPVKTQISLGIRQVWTESAVRLKKATWASAQADLSLC